MTVVTARAGSRLVALLRWAPAVGLIVSFSSSASWLPRPPIWLFVLAVSYGIGALIAADWKGPALRGRAFAAGLGVIVLIGAAIRLWQIGADLDHVPLDVDENRLAPRPTPGSRGRQLSSEGGRVYLPPLGFAGARLDIELELLGGASPQTASAHSLPEPITVEIEDEAVPVEKVATDGSRTRWSSAPIRERSLPQRVVAVRLTSRGNDSTRVVHFAVRR